MLTRVAALAALGGFLFGYDLGLIGGAMLGISEAFNITSNTTKQAIVGAAKLGAFFGTFLGGVLMLRYGRRLAIAFESGFFVLGPIIMATAMGPGGLVAGRLIVGLGVGASAIVVPAYLAEIAPAAKRGAVVQTYEMMLTLGMLSAGVVDWVLSSSRGPSAWRWMVGIPAVPGALLLLSLVLLPESPRWLVLRGNLDLALNTLHKIIQSSSSRGSSSSSTGPAAAAAAALPTISAAESQALAQAEDELLLLWSSVQKEQAASVMLRQQRQQQTTTAAAAQGIAPATEHLHVNGNSRHHHHHQQQHYHQHQQQQLVQQYPQAAAANCAAQPSTTTASQHEGSAAVTSTAAAAAGGGLYTLDEHECEAAVDNLDNSENKQQQGMSTAAAAQPPAAAAAATRGQDVAILLPDASSKGHPSGGPEQAVASAVDSSNDVQQQQQQQQWSAADDGQSEQLLSHQHNSSSHHGTDDYQGSASLHQSGFWKTGGLGVWLRGWVRRRDGAKHYSSSSTTPPAAAAAGASRSRSLQCEPGYEPNVFASSFAMLSDIVTIAKGPERAAFAIAASLAVFNQATASTSVINYTPEVLNAVLGVTERGSAILLPAVITVTKCVGVGIALMVVDAWGRKPLLIWGGVGCGAALLLAGLALAISSVTLFLTCLCLFIFSFSVSWAGLYWVVVSEIFSMGAKSPATSAATSLLFLTGSIVDFLFLSLVSWLGAGAFGLFAAVAFGSAWYVFRAVPETKGRTLVEIQAMLAAPAAADHHDRHHHGGRSDQMTDRDGVVTYGRWRGWDWGRTTRPATAAAARSGVVRTDQAGESVPLQQQQQQQHIVRNFHDDGQSGSAAASADVAGDMLADESDSSEAYWQQWMRRQQQQHSSSNGVTLPLGRELRSTGSGSRSRGGGVEYE